jgi:hypothetical protein
MYADHLLRLHTEQAESKRKGPEARPDSCGRGVGAWRTVSRAPGPYL